MLKTHREPKFFAAGIPDESPVPGLCGNGVAAIKLPRAVSSRDTHELLPAMMNLEAWDADVLSFQGH